MHQHVKATYDNMYVFQKNESIQSLFDLIEGVLAFIPVSFVDDYAYRIRKCDLFGDG